MAQESNGNSAFTPVSELGEFGLISRIESIVGKKKDKSLLKGLGDDAAVYEIGEGKVNVITADMLVERVHFDRTFMPYRYLGFKSISVNVSDIVAMNAKPKYAIVSLGLPSNISVEMIEDLYRGMQEAADIYDMSIVGGDTSGSDRLVINVSLVGEGMKEEIVYRSGAKPGDRICVSGELGGAFAGLKLLLQKKEEFEQEDSDFDPGLGEFDEVVRRQLMPAARYDVFKTLSDLEIVPTSMIDISDGLASELNHLSTASGCGFEISSVDIPIHVETLQVATQMNEDSETFALFGGEDYELLFTVTDEDWLKLAESELDIRHIGDCVVQEGVRLEVANGEMMNIDSEGYQHF